MSKTLMVVAGGTGGHIFPGIAVAKELSSQGWKVVWLGTADRMESEIVPQHGFDIEFIEVSGVRGNGIARLIKSPFMVLKAIFQARELMKKHKPSVVLGMGGYVTGPAGVAAKMAGIPLVIHEQNAAAGLTNRLLAKVASQVLEGFPNAFSSQGVNSNVQFVGNPVRKELAELKTNSLGDEIKVLVIGGSLGARALNQSLPAIFGEVASHFGVSVWHQVGKGNQESVLASYQSEMEKITSLKVTEFIDEMSVAYQWADIVICRAGALTVSEIAAAGVTAIFIPLPHAVDDHQTKNAQWLVDKQAGFIVQQEDMNNGELLRLLLGLIGEPMQLPMIASNARSLAVLDSSETVAQVCEQLAS